MNKRIKKKRLLADLLLANNLQQEVIEAYGHQLGDLERRVSELEGRVTANTLATNNRFDQLEAENKALQDETAELKQSLKPKKSWFGRK